jgi:hypothetical protein
MRFAMAAGALWICVAAVGCRAEVPIGGLVADGGTGADWQSDASSAPAHPDGSAVLDSSSAPLATTPCESTSPAAFTADAGAAADTVACIQGAAHDGDAVWRSDSATLSITNNATSMSPPVFSECSPEYITWTFDSCSGHLAMTGCENGKPLNRTSELSIEQRSQVVATLDALRSTLFTATIADAPEVAVVVTSSQGVDSKYSGYPWFLNGSVLCCGAPPVPAAVPTIDSGALFCLENFLDSLVDRPLLLGEWCKDTLACAPGLSCRADTDAGGGYPRYCHAGP